MLLVHDGPARTRCVLTVLEPARKERNSNDIRIEIKSSPVSWRKNSIVGQPVAYDRYTRFAEHTVLAHSDAHGWHTAYVQRSAATITTALLSRMQCRQRRQHSPTSLNCITPRAHHFGSIILHRLVSMAASRAAGAEHCRVYTARTTQARGAG